MYHWSRFLSGRLALDCPNVGSIDLFSQVHIFQCDGAIRDLIDTDNLLQVLNRWESQGFQEHPGLLSTRLLPLVVEIFVLINSFHKLTVSGSIFGDVIVEILGSTDESNLPFGRVNHKRTLDL